MAIIAQRRVTPGRMAAPRRKWEIEKAKRDPDFTANIKGMLKITE